MSKSIYDKVIQALKQAENHNSNIMVKPEAILWPDPENQWLEVIADLQKDLPELLVYGSYVPAQKTGPAIWIKCMLAKMLPEADWSEERTPIIYLPGISKENLRNVENAVFNLQPLIEYQYTGVLFLQENGREWSVLAFVENPINGLGVKINKDNATKIALKKTLSSIFRDPEVLYGRSLIDAEYLNSQLLPDVIPAILKWMSAGDDFLSTMDLGKREAFKNIFHSQYGVDLDYKNIKAVAEKLGSQKGAWHNVWQHYVNAPHKYPGIEERLRLGKPEDLGIGLYVLPDESWPQVNEKKEADLSNGLSKAAKADAHKALEKLHDLERQHGVRRGWVWSELGQSPLANALQFLVPLAEKSLEMYASGTIEALKSYYIERGYEVDQLMRKSMVAVKSDKDRKIIKSIIQLFYRPWLENITHKFQKLIATDSTIFTNVSAGIETESYVLFVDAFRYELAEEFTSRLHKSNMKVSLEAGWSAIPSLTATAKVHMSPIANQVSLESNLVEFKPQLNNGKDLLTLVFREMLKVNEFQFISNSEDIQSAGRYWQEIGDIDTKGHEEQAGMVKRVEELFDQIQETLELAFSKGIKRIKIVTDHGWLLLPGGLPKTHLNAGLFETRWGRCALIKEGVNTDLLHLAWRWNPSIFIAYAPGISFFKANEEYAHGGISIHECLIPTMIIENSDISSIEARIQDFKWVNLKCSIHSSEVPDGYGVDIRTKYNDAETSIVLKSKPLKGNMVTLMVNDDAEAQAATIVLLDPSGIILDKKLTTVGG